MPFQQTIMTSLGINATYWVISQVNVCMNPASLAAHLEVQGFASEDAYTADSTEVLETLCYDWPYTPPSIPPVNPSLTGDALTAAQAAYESAVTARNAIVAAMAQFPFAPAYVIANFGGNMVAAGQYFVMIQGPLSTATVVSS